MPTEHVERFRQAVQQYAKESNPVMPVLTLEADKLLMPQEITMENITGLEALAPFGEGNSVPVFAICHAVLQSVLPLSGGTHSKLKITYGGMAMDLLLFRTRPEEVMLKTGDVCDFLINIEVGSFQGRPQLSVIVKDYRKSGLKQAKYFAAENTYEQYCRHEELQPSFYPAITPTRTCWCRSTSGSRRQIPLLTDCSAACRICRR